MKGIVNIPKIPGQLNIDTSALTIQPENLVTELPFTRPGNGAVEAVPSNDNIEVRTEADRLIITGRKSGAASLTVRAAAGTEHTGTVTQTINVTTKDMPSPILAENSPDIMQRVTHAGFASVPGWKPGDKVPRELSGTVGVTDVSGEYYDVLLGIDHNPEFELEHSLQFGLAWYASDGKTPIAFVDDKYNTGYYDARRDFRMNTDYRNLTAGYSGMQLRSVLQEFFGTITDEELKKRIVACPKYVDDGAYIAQGVSDPKDVTVLRDVIWLPSQYEMFPWNASPWEPKSEYAVTEQYPIFPGSASRIAYAFNNLTQAVWWWLRSRSTSSAGYFRIVYTDGATSSYGATWSYGARPCYMVS